jgi:hypothetical protein
MDVEVRVCVQIEEWWAENALEIVLTLEGLHDFENEDIGSMQYLGRKTN